VRRIGRGNFIRDPVLPKTSNIRTSSRQKQRSNSAKSQLFGKTDSLEPEAK
jgi:hypothetical protein